MSTVKFPRGRALALVSALALGAIALTGCSSGSSGAGATAGGGASGPLNILVSSAPGSDAGFQAVTKAFEKKYPKVSVHLSSVPNENYNQAKASRLTAGSADILVASPRQVPSYVPASNEGDDARLADQGGYLNLTNEPFMRAFNPSVLAAAKYKGKNYTVPTGLSYYTGMFYNKKIFTDNNLTVPTTWSDLLKTCAALKAKGIVPLGIAGKDSAGVMTLGVTEGLYPSANAMTTLAKDLYAGKAKLNSGTPLELLQKVQTLYGYAEPNFAGVSYATMTADFVNGKFAMMPDGTWNTTTIQKSGAGKLDFGYVPLPSSDNAADNANLGGKVELSLAVPSNAKHQKAALQWLDFFTKNYKLFNDQAGFAPAVQGATSNPFYASIQPYTKKFLPAWDTIWIANTKAGPAASVPFNWAGVAPMGSSNAQGAADAAEHDWQAGLK